MRSQERKRWLTSQGRAAMDGVEHLVGGFGTAALALATLLGLIATALTGAVLASTGAALVEAFHVAALIGATSAAAAAATAFLTLEAKR